MLSKLLATLENYILLILTYILKISTSQLEKTTKLFELPGFPTNSIAKYLIWHNPPRRKSKY